VEVTGGALYVSFDPSDVTFGLYSAWVPCMKTGIEMKQSWQGAASSLFWLIHSKFEESPRLHNCSNLKEECVCWWGSPCLGAFAIVRYFILPCTHTLALDVSGPREQDTEGCWLLANTHTHTHTHARTHAHTNTHTQLFVRIAEYCDRVVVCSKCEICVLV